jgi:hypothetical protein
LERAFRIIARLPLPRATTLIAPTPVALLMLLLLLVANMMMLFLLYILSLSLSVVSLSLCVLSFFFYTLCSRGKVSLTLAFFFFCDIPTHRDEWHCIVNWGAKRERRARRGSIFFREPFRRPVFSFALPKKEKKSKKSR